MPLFKGVFPPDAAGWCRGTSTGLDKSGFPAEYPQIVLATNRSKAEFKFGTIWPKMTPDATIRALSAGRIFINIPQPPTNQRDKQP
ncbi:MAG: hypothetical protein Q8K62_09435 [Thiobacillus sp.]|nr:hypothetical protein [Thiobacillus sp.]